MENEEEDYWDVQHKHTDTYKCLYKSRIFEVDLQKTQRTLEREKEREREKQSKIHIPCIAKS